MTLQKLTALFLFVITVNVCSAQLVPTYDDLQIPMRDSEMLEIDVYLPAGPGPFEVILIQTPYDKDNFENWLPLGVGLNLNGQPFAWVIADWRGFYGSNGMAAGSGNRGEDGYDICEWIVDQAWHGSRIGTWGPSALGKVQYDTAEEQHPNHTCAVPLVAHPQFSYDDYFYGGVLEESRLQQLDALGYGLSPIIMSNVYYSNTWAFAENGSWNPDLIIIPTLQIGGWYDHNITKMMEWYEATRSAAALAVQDEQWLLVGPWVHGGTGAAYVGSSVQGELTYPNAELVSDAMAWDFLNYYLLDTPNSWETTPLITYYQMGSDIWQTSNNETVDIPTFNLLYLDQNEKLRGQFGYASTAFVSDPNNPSPTIGGATLSASLDQGPYDQTSLESRSDILTFSTDALSTNVTTTGHVTLDLYIECDQPDADISIRLIDEYPDGRNMLINDGIRRMRFRNGYELADEVFMTDGQIYPVQITMPFVNYTWLAGHKIKILVGGNSDNRWDVNLQNGGAMYTPGTANVAEIVIHHSSDYPSIISLPGNNPVLDVAEMQEEKVYVYPNPVRDVLQFNTSTNWSSYSIFSLTGELIQSGDFANNQISVAHLAEGMYTVVLSNSNSTSRTKFVKRN